MTEASNSTGVRVSGIDPAKVAARITGCREGSGLWVGYCAVHRFIGHGFVQGRWPCSVHAEATEVVRAALEQAWHEGFDTGRDQWSDGEFVHVFTDNPYKALRDEPQR